MDTEYTISTTNLTAIANAVRSKTGTAGTITPTNLAAAINSLDSTWTGTQEEYDELESYDNSTFYFIIEDEEEEVEE